MKKTGSALILFLTSINIFAGSFFVNFLVIGSDKNAVESVVDKLNNNVIGIYDEYVPGHYVLCEKISEMRDTNYGLAICKILSRKLSCPVLYTLVYDSDILLLCLIENYSVTFSYNSWPGYWAGDEKTPKIKNLENFSSIFGADEKSIEDVLNLDYVFAEDILFGLSEIIELPESIYYGYNYASQETSELEEYGFAIKVWERK